LNRPTSPHRCRKERRDRERRAAWSFTSHLRSTIFVEFSTWFIEGIQYRPDAAHLWTGILSARIIVSSNCSSSIRTASQHSRIFITFIRLRLWSSEFDKTFRGRASVRARACAINRALEKACRTRTEAHMHALALALDREVLKRDADRLSLLCMDVYELVRSSLCYLSSGGLPTVLPLLAQASSCLIPKTLSLSSICFSGEFTPSSSSCCVVGFHQTTFHGVCSRASERLS
jgi:hypothetical protein